MKRILLAGAVLALAACSSGSPATAPSTAAPSSPASSPAVSPLDAATAGVVCAAVNALVYGGATGAHAIATAASAYHVTTAQVVRAIDDRCPALKRIVPAGA